MWLGEHLDLDPMRQEGIDVLEKWFRRGGWSMLWRIYGHVTHSSSALEIGCGLGCIVFPLRSDLRALRLTSE
jgi:hypothetical protein